jgi:hypothetical protein
VIVDTEFDKKPKPPAPPAAAAKDKTAEPTPPVKEITPPKPAFPADLGQWTLADFLSARSAGEPRLTAAVLQRVEHPQRTVEEAAMLTTLLECKAMDPKKEGNKPAELTSALVRALVANGTATAESCVLGLLTGDILAPDDQIAVDAAMTAMVRIARVETEDAVARAILTPEELRPAGRGQVVAEGLRKAALAAVRAGGSSRLRLRLTTAAVDPHQPGSLKLLLRALLSEPVVENLEAMAVLYGSPATDAGTRVTIETYLANSSSQFVGQLLQIPETMPALVALPPPARLAALWNAELGAAVTRQLELLESLSSQPRLILLAATIPTDTVRPVLYQALRRNWDDGPQCLTTVLMAPQSCWEPGFYVTTKLLRPSLTDTADQVAKVKSRLTKRKPVRAPPPGKKDEDLLRLEWLHMQYSMLLALCQRVNASGRAQEGVASAVAVDGQGNHDAEPPIPLHEGARVVTRLDLDWPKGLPEGVPERDVAVTQVKYIRIQQTTTRLKALVNHYRQELGSPAEHPLQDGLTLWLESHKRLPDSGRCRSVDVIITRDKKTYQPRDPEEKIALEILSVEMNDPTRSQ